MFSQPIVLSRTVDLSASRHESPPPLGIDAEREKDTTSIMRVDASVARNNAQIRTMKYPVDRVYIKTIKKGIRLIKKSNLGKNGHAEIVVTWGKDSRTPEAPSTTLRLPSSNKGNVPIIGDVIFDADAMKAKFSDYMDDADEAEHGHIVRQYQYPNDSTFNEAIIELPNPHLYGHGLASPMLSLNLIQSNNGWKKWSEKSKWEVTDGSVVHKDGGDPVRFFLFRNQTKRLLAVVVDESKPHSFSPLTKKLINDNFEKSVSKEGLRSLSESLKESGDMTDLPVDARTPMQQEWVDVTQIITDLPSQNKKEELKAIPVRTAVESTREETDPSSVEEETDSSMEPGEEEEEYETPDEWQQDESDLSSLFEEEDALYLDASIGKWFTKAKNAVSKKLTQGKNFVKETKEKVREFRRKRKEKSAAKKLENAAKKTSKTDARETKKKNRDSSKAAAADKRASKAKEDAFNARMKADRYKDESEERDRTASRRIEAARAEEERLRRELEYIQTRKNQKLQNVVDVANEELDDIARLNAPSAPLISGALPGATIKPMSNGLLVSARVHSLRESMQIKCHENNTVSQMTITKPMNHYRSPVSAYLDNENNTLRSKGYISSHEVSHLTWSHVNRDAYASRTDFDRVVVRRGLVMLRTSKQKPDFNKSGSYTMVYQEVDPDLVFTEQRDRDGTFVMDYDFSQSRLTEADLENRIGEILFNDPITELPFSLLFHLHNSESKPPTSSGELSIWSSAATESLLGVEIVFDGEHISHIRLRASPAYQAHYAKHTVEETRFFRAVKQLVKNPPEDEEFYVATMTMTLRAVAQQLRGKTDELRVSYAFVTELLAVLLEIGPNDIDEKLVIELPDVLESIQGMNFEFDPRMLTSISGASTVSMMASSLMEISHTLISMYKSMVSNSKDPELDVSRMVRSIAASRFSRWMKKMSPYEINGVAFLLSILRGTLARQLPSTSDERITELGRMGSVYRYLYRKE